MAGHDASTHADISVAARRALEMLDLTSLGDDDSEADIDRLCHAATTPHGPVAAVCVWPRFVGRARNALEGNAVRVAAVANFPDGDAAPDVAAAEAADAVAAGAHEVDVVYPWRSHLAGVDGAGAALVGAVRSAVGSGVTLKVILETGSVAAADSVTDMARVAVDAGADFLKTSTGKVGPGATPDAVATLLDVVAEAREAGRHVGVKVSGGVRDLATAAAYLALADERMGPGWACIETFRFGASGLLADLLRVLDGGS
jgi:deoxyribose-phosphate aldolase